MEEIRIVCPNCGQTFLADGQKKQVFCVHCGTMVDRSAEVAAHASGTTRQTPEEQTLAAAREAFAAARFPVIDRRSGQKGDRLIELWTLLLYHGQNSRSRWAIRTATRDIAQFFDRREWQAALQLAGSERQRLITEQMLDSAVVFLTACRDDSRYGSKLLGMIRMGSEDIAVKTAHDICANIIRFLLKIGCPGETEAIIHAAVMAYPRVFSSQRQVLADQMAEELTPEERSQALAIVAAVAARTASPG
jgi:hypothetical protein